MLHIVICIKHVCDLFDAEQSKKTRVQTTGASAIVKARAKNLINYLAKQALSTGCAERYSVNSPRWPNSILPAERLRSRYCPAPPG
ncbi:hypothetical protein E3V94_16160 [Enterobacter sp. AD2-3]|nr:hypothetical protein E2E36_02415 [Enterobacter cloacae complex sp.]THC27023.1 hypothetical protein E3V94_16160 [Enterobacter sp. AD2-3]